MWRSLHLGKEAREDAALGRTDVDDVSNADAVVEQGDGTLVFVEPYETSETFGNFLDYVQKDSGNSKYHGETPVKYAQTRVSPS